MAKKKNKRKGGNQKETQQDNTGTQYIIQQIITRPANRRRSDIQDWRSAHKSAENSRDENRVRLYDLYEDILLDPILSSAIEKRVMAVTNTKLRFVRDNEDVKEVTDIIETRAFNEMLEEVMAAKFWGISVQEITFKKGLLKAYNVPRKHIRPTKGIITYRQHGSDGFSYRHGKFVNTILEVGKPKDLGRLVKAVPYVLWKRGAMGDWAQLSEIYGHPTKVGKYSGYDTQTRLALEEALDESGAALSIIIPEEAKLDFLESKNAAANSDIYNTLRKACNEALLILILGQTGTTEDSANGGYAQAKIHANTEDDINKDDRKFILSVLKESFNDILEKAGINTKGGKWLFEDPEENISLKDRVIIDGKLKEMGLPMADEYLYERYTVPKPKNYKKLKAEQQAKANQPPIETDPKKEENKPKKKKKKAKKEEPSKPTEEEQTESKLMASINSFLSLFRSNLALKSQGACLKLHDELNDLYDNECGHTDCTIHLSDDEIPFTDVELEKWIKAIYEKGGRVKLHQPSIDAFAEAFYDALQKGYGVVYDDLDAASLDYEVMTHLRKNVYQFSAAKNKSELKLLTEAILDKEGEVRSFANFKAAAAKITDLHRVQYMRTEYNLAVAGSQMASKWNDFESTDLLKYSTVDDDRVRPEHRLLDGVTKPASDPFWDVWYPPNGFGCRCDVEVVLYGSITPNEDIPAPDSIPPIMRTNLAKQRLVFPKDHPYFTD